MKNVQMFEINQLRKHFIDLKNITYLTFIYLCNLLEVDFFCRNGMNILLRSYKIDH
jgi:hypothetical protein